MDPQCSPAPAVFCQFVKKEKIKQGKLKTWNPHEVLSLNVCQPCWQPDLCCPPKGGAGCLPPHRPLPEESATSLCVSTDVHKYRGQDEGHLGSGAAGDSRIRKLVSASFACPAQKWRQPVAPSPPLRVQFLPASPQSRVFSDPAPTPPSVFTCQSPGATSFRGGEMRSVSVLGFAAFPLSGSYPLRLGEGKREGGQAARLHTRWHTRWHTRTPPRGRGTEICAGRRHLPPVPPATSGRRCPAGACSPIRGSLQRAGVDGRAAGPLAEPGRRALHFPPERQASSSRTCGSAAVCRVSWKLGPPPGWSGERKTPVWVGDTSTQTKKGECGVLQRGPTDPVKVRREAGAWRHRGQGGCGEAHGSWGQHWCSPGSMVPLPLLDPET